MPAQPPLVIPTRTPTTGRSAFARISRTRTAAASVSRITCGFGLMAICLLLSDRVQRPAIGRFRAGRPALILEHDLFRKPVPTPDSGAGFFGIMLQRTKYQPVSSRSMWGYAGPSATPSPHIEDQPRLVGHPARVP